MPLDPSRAQALAEEMQRQSVTMQEDETARRIDEAFSPDTWRALAPEMTIGGTVRSFEVPAAPLPPSDGVLADLVRQSYFRAPPIFDLAATSRILRAVELVRAAGWLPVFAFVFDDLWSLTRGAGMRRMLHEVSGDGHRQLPMIWVFHVSPHLGSRGWRPHVDYESLPALGDEGRPSRLTLWMPLTDATLDNGCMYVAPASADEELWRCLYGEATTRDAIELLHRARALPTSAGSILGWHGRAVHWGSTVSPNATHARVAVSSDFALPVTNVGEDAPPMIDVDVLPPFELRLAAIARSIRTYAARPWEPRAARFSDWAKRALAKTGGA